MGFRKFDSLDAVLIGLFIVLFVVIVLHVFFHLL